MNNSYEPDELVLVQDVFEEIVSMPSFSPEERARKAFGRCLIDRYPGGSFDRDKHYEELIRAAERGFAAR
ncbi:hypothetical protein J2Y63_006751 [Shinella sp. BE166]|jgi:hypothetical protein|uniref:hypothetical protein n=1 Tax=Shinella sp. BE166 TaxID=3373918 RepID=UPI003EB97F92